MAAGLSRSGRWILGALATVFAAELAFALAAPTEVAGYRVILHWTGVSLHAVLEGRLWTVASYMLVHSLDGWGHLFANALGVWFATGELERRYGCAQVLRLAVAAGLAGGLAVVLTQAVAAAFGAPASLPTIGASGAVLGLVAGFCRVFWCQRLLVWGVLPTTGRGVFVVLVALQAVLVAVAPAVSVAAHAGGMAVGYVAVGPRPRMDTVWLRLRHWRARRRLRVVVDNTRQGADTFH